eukprot:scaffold26902_cov98-Cylindrotheca_fusiformis.AAC.2
MDYLVPAALTLVIGPVTLFVLRSTMLKPPTSSAGLKDAALNFLRQGSLMTRRNNKAKPGVVSHNFGHALGLCHETIDMDRLTVSKNHYTYRHLLSKDRPMTPGMAVALMDEMTAHLMGCAGSPAGASLFFQVEWLPKKKKIVKAEKEEEDDYIDIVNTLTKKGRTIAHTRTDFVSSDQQVIGYSTHVKYMPSGSFFFDGFLRYYPPWLSPFLNKLAMSKLAEAPSTPTVTVGAHETVENNLKIISDGKAEFTKQDEHCNPMGSLHGGCTAMLMEKVAEPYAKNLLKSSIVCESIQIQFIAAARGRQTLEVDCEPIDVVEKSHALVRVNLRKPKKGKKKDSNHPASLLAQGLFRFTVA